MQDHEGLQIQPFFPQQCQDVTAWTLSFHVARHI